VDQSWHLAVGHRFPWQSVPTATTPVGMVPLALGGLWGSKPRGLPPQRARVLLTRRLAVPTPGRAVPTHVGTSLSHAYIILLFFVSRISNLSSNKKYFIHFTLLWKIQDLLKQFTNFSWAINISKLLSPKKGSLTVSPPVGRQDYFCQFFNCDAIFSKFWFVGLFWKRN
jgi:hypothetical protein